MKTTKLLKTLAIIFSLSFALLSAGGLIYFVHTYRSIDLDRELEEPSILLDREGNEVGRFAAEIRRVITLEEMSPNLINAVIAVEDSRFYQHFGLDPRGIGRAMWRNVLGRRVREGGSTITQQLAKNEYFISGQQGPARTIERKLREAIYALKLERTFTKDEILVRYLNRIYFGHGRFGIEAASRFYFNKSTQDLTLAEAAMLAGIPNGPALFSPRINPVRSNERKDFVLTRMLETDQISAAEFEAASGEFLTAVEVQEPAARANHFRQRVEREVRQILASHYPNLEDKEITSLIYTHGLQITTTLSLQAQAAAEQVMLEHGAKVMNRAPEIQGVLVAIDPATGGIMAIAESINLKGTFLRADNTRYNMGSSLKGILYIAALEEGYTAASTVVCEPTEFPIRGTLPYTPSDNGTFHNRALRLREALGFSCNVAAVKVNLDIGPQRFLDLTGRLNPRLAGNRILELHGELQLPLGPRLNPLDLTLVYAPLVNGGYSVTPHTVQEIRDRDGNLLYRAYPNRQLALDERYGFIATSMLQEVVPGQGLPFDTAGKTGTSDDGHVVFVGYSSNLVATVFFGFDQPRPDQSPGSSFQFAAPAWRDFMRGALKGTSPPGFTRPQGIEDAITCSVSGQLATPSCPETYTEHYIPGTIPQQCQVHGGATVEICISSWRPVNQWCPANTRIFLPREPWIPPSPCDVHGPSGEGTEGEDDGEEAEQGGGSPNGDEQEIEGDD